MAEFNRRQLFHQGLGGLAIAGASTLTLQADAAPTAKTLDVHNYQDFLDKNGIPQVQPAAKWEPSRKDILGPYFLAGAPFRGKVTPPLEPGELVVMRGRIWGHDTRKPISVHGRTLNVTIPAGTADNERIRLKGKGEPGSDGAPSGDLYLRVRLVPHPVFDVEGHDLLVTVPVAPWEAALGAKLQVPTLSGRISLTLPAGSQTGRRLRVKGKGLAGKKTPGDLYAIIKIVMPERISDRDRELWRALAEQSDFDPRANWAGDGRRHDKEPRK